MIRDPQYPDCPYVFFRDGEPIRDFRDAWNRSCRIVGLEGRLFHDLRRTAVRNLIQSGVSEAVAMKISGHRTRSIFSKYKIVSESDLAKVAQALDRFEADSGTTSNEIVVAEKIIKEAQRS
jgi:integrase